MANEKRILDNIDLESSQGLSVCVESASGIANATKSAVGIVSQQSQTNNINSATENEQISASGLFTSSQSTTQNKK